MFAGSKLAVGGPRITRTRLALTVSILGHAGVGALVLSELRLITVPEATPPGLVTMIFEGPASAATQTSKSQSNVWPEKSSSHPKQTEASDPITSEAQPTNERLPSLNPMVGGGAKTAPLPEMADLKSEEPGHVAKEESSLTPAPQSEVRMPPAAAPKVETGTTAAPPRPPSAIRTRRPVIGSSHATDHSGPAPTPVMPPRALSASVPSNAPAEISSGWRTELVNWLQTHKSYPDDARRRAEEGTVVIRVTVGRDGAVLSVALVRGSGSSALDEAAQAVFRNNRLPAFTGDMIQDRATVTVPIHYRLKS